MRVFCARLSATDRAEGTVTIMSGKENPKWKAFIAWLNTPEHLRGSIATEEEWGAANGVTTRTMRRWKQEPAFIELRDSMVDEAVAQVDVASSGGSDEDTYRAVKARLVEGARSGNVKSLELYFKTYGKPFVDDEVAARSVDLSSVELPVLVGRAVLALAPEELERVLRDAGWVVERPAGG